ncbi:hypothetical protein MYX78_08080 [Acidobacteria bacterium AH-259-G07]|nr:hypothetical protein [Acidobacteria bacterium AH-259-G07]
MTNVDYSPSREDDLWRLRCNENNTLGCYVCYVSCEWRILSHWTSSCPFLLQINVSNNNTRRSWICHIYKHSYTCSLATYHEGGPRD